ncbi:FAD-dependent oxidoreductase [Gordonia sp. (in: high G+C Gram-positive bacteria)]|uniref:FAD-dependent oxidoreductase n=1 Tax=Gordonia sp. (in: high G+C Gram-positive bacteria) TaxID=84139 RepID=UPI003340A45F
MTEFSEQYDVVVIGSGAAGSAAALEATANGASVLVVEKSPESTAGGNTRVSGSGWFVNRAADRAEVFLRTLNGSFPVADDVVEAWAQATVGLSDWMRSMGADVGRSGDFHTEPEYQELDGSDCYAGMDTIGGRMGDGLLYGFLRRALEERGVEVRFGTRATALVTDGGAVVGVDVDGPAGRSRIGARGGVVLATGGFSANPQMVRDYLRVEEHVLWGSPASTGDGHAMAQRIGADLWHMDNMMTITGIRGDDEFGHFLALWGAQSYLWVGDDGRRFIDETATPKHGHTVRSGRHELFPTRAFHLIFDEAVRSAGPLSPAPDVLPVGWNMLMKDTRWSADNSAEIESGMIVRADTLAELADAIGLDADVLVRSVETYNQACDDGVDDSFGRPAATLAAVRRGPFYALRVTPLLGWSNGGPRRDGRSRVLRTDGSVIDGLYAAGEVSSTYSWRKDGGFHIADALALGRVSGREAAARAAN